MSFKKLARDTYSTKRPPARVDGKRGGTPVTHLENVPFVPLYPKRESNTSAQGRAETIVEGIEFYAQYSTHTDGGVEVTQVPDVVEDDYIVDSNGNEYKVTYVGTWPQTNVRKSFIQVITEEAKT
jgi:hypothetical protein